MRRRSQIMTALALLLGTLVLAACGNSAKPVPVKTPKAAPPYAGNGIDAVGVGRDPSHHSPFGAPSGAEVDPAAKKP